jgi:glycine betaine/proline transport system substrate-binding protein
MRSIKTLLGTSLLALSLSVGAVSATEKTAPIHFGDITWESGSFITEVLRLIVEKGYGYPTDTLPGSTVSLEAALA